MLEESFKKDNDPNITTGSKEGEYLARSATTENSLQLLQNSLSSLSVVIGTHLLPVISAGAKALAWSVNGVVALANECPVLTQGIVMIGAAWGAWKVAKTAGSIAGAAMNLLSGSIEKASILTELNGTTSMWAAAKTII
jgi:hypothetical protein